MQHFKFVNWLIGEFVVPFFYVTNRLWLLWVLSLYELLLARVVFTNFSSTKSLDLVSNEFLRLFFSACRFHEFFINQICNPTILAVHELYIRSFHMLNEFPEILTESDQENFSHLLRQLLDDHKDVVSQLASGFKECRKHMKVRPLKW